MARCSRSRTQLHWYSRKPSLQIQHPTDVHRVPMDKKVSIALTSPFAVGLRREGLWPVAVEERH